MMQIKTTCCAFLVMEHGLDTIIRDKPGAAVITYKEG